MAEKYPIDDRLRGRKIPCPASDGFYAYILLCADGSLYTGWTNNLTRRLSSHNQGSGSKYTRTRRPVHLVYYEELGTKQEAMSREWHLKRLSRNEKMERVLEYVQENGTESPMFDRESSSVLI